MPKVCSQPYCKKVAEGKFKTCQPCRLSRRKSNKKSREKARKATARDGHKYCTHCHQEFPLTHFQSSRSRRKSLTAWCATCRINLQESNAKDESKKGTCRKIWMDWKTSRCCELCGYKGEWIEADHPKEKKTKDCSNYCWWSCHGGPKALKEELSLCRPLCRFCHRIFTQEQRKNKPKRVTIIKKKYVNTIKLKKGKCELCERKRKKNVVLLTLIIWMLK